MLKKKQNLSILNVLLQRPGDGQQEALQDVDDWDLTELNPEWDSVGESGDDTGSPLPPLVPPLFMSTLSHSSH